MPFVTVASWKKSGGRHTSLNWRRSFLPRPMSAITSTSFATNTFSAKPGAAVKMDILWSLGRSAFGIHPTRPLKILCVQAENDGGDLAEMAHGVCDHLNLTEGERKLVHERVIYVNEKAATGDQFLRLIRRL